MNTIYSPYILFIILSILLFVYIAIITSTTDYDHTTFALAQLLEKKTKNSTLFYGCEEYDQGIFHCDRLHNKLESFRIKSNSSTLYNATDTPMFVAGEEGSALQMYANHLKSIIFSNTSTILPKQFSIAFWIRGVPLLDSPEISGVGYIISQFTRYHPGGWSFISTIPYKQNLSNESVRFTVYNNKGEAFSSPDVPIYHNNSFTHIVGTFDGSSIKVYKDGSFFGEVGFNGTFNNNIRIPLTLGVSSRYPMSFYWTGNIDDLRYYNKVVSINEIKQIFNDPNSIAKNASKSLIGHWKFNGNLDDISGNNHQGSERTLISSMVFAPDGRLFFSEKDTGNIKIMENGKVKSKPFATLYDYHSNWEQGLLGLAIDPDFKKNHFLFLFYTTVDKDTREPFNRIVRFTDTDSQGVNETIILDRIPASNGYHSGGAVAFGLDNKLYVTIGDATVLSTLQVSKHGCQR
jgi:Glucose / Sorbosone dehydrogenase/Concanavalin A-like lectin/glucanases superfamily